MRFIITAQSSSEHPPTDRQSEFDAELFKAYMRFNEEMHLAGVLVASEGLNPAAKGARIAVANGKRYVVDGPFAESKELVGGFTSLTWARSTRRFNGLCARRPASGWTMFWRFANSRGRQTCSLRFFDSSPRLRRHGVLRLGSRATRTDSMDVACCRGGAARASKAMGAAQIRYAINSHAHFDHSGSVRAAVAEGAIIVTQAANVPYFERALAQSRTVRPDRLTQSGKAPRLQAVADTSTMADATRTIELHRITGSAHSDTFLMVYLPREKLLIEADAFTPAAPNTPPPAVANANHLNLIDNIERLQLGVERILPLHGRVVPVGDLYAAAGRTPAR